jgi:hypothetical protein
MKDWWWTSGVRSIGGEPTTTYVLMDLMVIYRLYYVCKYVFFLLFFFLWVFMVVKQIPMNTIVTLW